MEDEDDQDILKESYGGKSLEGEILNQGAAAEEELFEDLDKLRIETQIE